MKRHLVNVFEKILFSSAKFVNNAAYVICLYIDHWFIRRSVLNEFPCINLCIMNEAAAGGTFL